MKKILISLAVLSVLFSCAEKQKDTEISILPQPQAIRVDEGVFEIGKATKIYMDPCTDEMKRVAGFINEKFAKAAGFELEIVDRMPEENFIAFMNAGMPTESYVINAKPHGVFIDYGDGAGAFYAVQTLFQLLPTEIYAQERQKGIDWTVPCCSIDDAPRFKYRGMHLDVCLHYFDFEFLKRYIDIMAAHKVNRFHWHLTEDQGWRIEIKKYPRLTEVGAWRNSKVLGWGDTKPDGIRYGGYYTREDVHEIVAYARERFIEIVPEVDIPGHSQAAVASYPGILACDIDKWHEVWLWQGVSADVINVAEPNAVRFAKDVIDELTEMFPFGYIHLGGDECPTIKWERNSRCRELLAEIGSKNYRDLQINFYKQLKEHIAAKPKEKQRKLIFWNEVLHGNTEPLGTDIAIMAWIGADRAAEVAASRGMTTILSPQIPYYINRRQSNLPTEPRSQGHGTETVEAVYNYIPMKGVAEKLQKQYLGVQANFWTEWVEDASTVQYLMLPRLAAVAEAGWTTQEQRDYNAFVERIQADTLYYRLKGLNYGKHIFK